jgi:hypothetical protein
LLFPSTAFWWLDYYEGFKQYIEHRYRVLEAGEQCWIAALTEARASSAHEGSMSSSSHMLAEQMSELLENLLPGEARTAVLVVAREDNVKLDRYETCFIPRITRDDTEGLREDLERIEADGVRFLVVPRTLFAWLEDNPELSEYLQGSHRLITRQANLCQVYELHKSLRPVEVEAVRTTAHSPEEEKNGSAHSFGQRLKNVIFRARRDDRGS